MKRTGNLFEKIIDWDNLYNAFKQTSRKRRYRAAALRYAEHLSDNIVALHDALVSGTWKIEISLHKHISYPKPRDINYAPFRDRVALHAIIDPIKPCFEKKFITHTYACIKGRGQLKAALEVQRMAYAVCLQFGSGYALKCDIHQYFATIDHNNLKHLVRRTIKDERVLALLDGIIDSTPGKIGIPLGSLASQLFANIYLDFLDHKLKEAYGVKSYVRQMDDFIIVHQSKSYLKNLLAVINKIIVEDLHLTLNPKTDIFPLRNGVDFCGYRIFPTYLLPRKRNKVRARRALTKVASDVNQGIADLEKFKRVFASYRGYFKYCKSHDTLAKILDDIKF